jgi:regulator of sigma E protease
MQVLFSIVMALVTLGILVTIHEYGHYWVARRCGVRVLRFAVGFGRPLACGWIGMGQSLRSALFRSVVM